jgi:hypothetical protein
VLNDPNNDWREDPHCEIAVRESLHFARRTTNEAYMPRKTMRPNSRWFLDNSMQDVNVQQARAMLIEIAANREHVGRL